MNVHIEDIEKDQYEREHLWSASSGLVRQWDRTSFELIGFGREEEEKGQRGTVGPCYLICLTLVSK